MIDTSTKVCAIIGNPVKHSLSPLIHNAAFKACGLNYVYLAFQVMNTNLNDALCGFRALEEFMGLSVTIPHKMEIVKYLDWVEQGALYSGSVNTVVKNGDKILGYNTDGMGVIEALREGGIEILRKKAIIIGTGGVARGIAFCLLQSTGLESLTIAGRNESKVEKICQDLKKLNKGIILSSSLNYEDLKSAISSADILIQCTSVGMWPNKDETLVPTEFLHKGLVVFDVIYTPLKTRLIIEAERRGCFIIPGVEMFLHQAYLQFELWTKMEAPKQIMRNIALDALRG